MQEKEIGKITHYYSNISVGIIQLSDTLKIGETIHVKGHSEDFTQPVDSIQIEHTNVSEAKSGDVIGIRLTNKVHPGDKVLKASA